MEDFPNYFPNKNLIGGMLLKCGDMNVRYDKMMTDQRFILGDCYIIKSKEYGLIGFQFVFHNLNWVRYNRYNITDVTIEPYTLQHRFVDFNSNQVGFLLHQKMNIRLNLGEVFCSKDFEIDTRYGMRVPFIDAVCHYKPPKHSEYEWAEKRLNAKYYFHLEDVKCDYRHRDSRSRMMSARQIRLCYSTFLFHLNMTWTNDFEYTAKTFRQINITDDVTRYKLTKHNVVLNDDVFELIKEFMGLTNYSFKNDDRVKNMSQYQAENLTLYVFELETYELYNLDWKKKDVLIDMCDKRANELRHTMERRNACVERAIRY